MYGVMAGINTDESNPGFKHIIFRPVTDVRLDFVNASIDTKYGKVSSSWSRDNGKIKYTFEVPDECTATVILGGDHINIGAGTHNF